MTPAMGLQVLIFRWHIRVIFIGIEIDFMCTVNDYMYTRPTVQVQI